MSKIAKSILLVVFLISLSVPLTMAAGHQTIVEIAAGDERFETLVAAVKAAGLADELSSGEWTVFAPTDDAFAKLDLNADNIAQTFSESELVDILLYHVLTKEMSTTELKADQGDTVMANGKLAGIKYFEGDIYVNDDSKVIIPDLLAANGVIHVVDTVILGPWPRDAEPEDEPITEPETPAGDSIVDIAIADGRFDTLVAAVVAAGLDDELAGGEWTVFAPTDDAFAKLDLNEDNIAEAFSESELVDILLYHVLTKEVSTTELKADQGDTVMANGKIAGVKYFDGDIYVNDDSKVIIPDIVVDNGVIHVVDTVILGPWPRK